MNRHPFTITSQFPVGKEFPVYHQDGMSKEWGRWTGRVVALDLDREEIMIELTQDWQGADTRFGQYWTERRTIPFKNFIIPIMEDR